MPPKIAPKRKTTSPTGVTPENKGARNDDRTDNTKSYAEVTANSIADSLAKKMGLGPGSVKSNRTNATHMSTSNPCKGTEEGSMRDQIVVDILTIDGEVCKDQLTDLEQNLIAHRLGIKAERLSGVAPGYYGGHPVYTYRLHELMELEKINPNEITLKRTRVNMNGQKYKAEIICKAHNISENQSNKNTNGNQSHIWVKLDDIQYKLESEEIIKWLELYGEVLSDVLEDQNEVNAREVDDDSDLSDSERDYMKCIVNRGNGTVKVKMLIETDIPQYIPMFGRKVRVYYRGIVKTCTNCYQKGHLKRDCKNKKRQWVSYIMDFMNQNEIPKEMYGRWTRVVANELKYNGYKPVEPIIINYDVEKNIPTIEEFNRNSQEQNAACKEAESSSEEESDQMETNTQPEPKEHQEAKNTHPEPEVIAEPKKSRGRPSGSKKREENKPRPETSQIKYSKKK